MKSETCYVCTSLFFLLFIVDDNKFPVYTFVFDSVFVDSLIDMSHISDPFSCVRMCYDCSLLVPIDSHLYRDASA